jgi:hypothetical protein
MATQGYINVPTSQKTGKVLAADLSVFYRKQVLAGSNGKNLTYSFSAVLSNLEPKIKYASVFGNSFIPTTLKAGGGISYLANSKNRFNFIIDASKLLIPVTTSASTYSNSPALQGV